MGKHKHKQPSESKGAAPKPPSPEAISELQHSLDEETQKKTARAFLPDDAIGHHWLFRMLVWWTVYFLNPLHSTTDVGWAKQDRKRGTLFYTRHSTHNGDILQTAALCYLITGRVARMLMHRLLVVWFPVLRYLGGIGGERNSAVALLKAGFWCGVIPGGADEGLTGHENAYRLNWPKKRVGFAKVAMEADSLLVPFFTRNVEESRFNPIMHIWHLLRGYKFHDWLIHAGIPVISNAWYLLGHIVWFSVSFIQFPIPVRTTAIFGDPVHFDKSVDTVDDVVHRCHDALQTLIDQHQPNAKEGRNYARALGERWTEWKEAKPKLISTIESITPAFVKQALIHAAKSKKKLQ